MFNKTKNTIRINIGNFLFISTLIILTGCSSSPDYSKFILPKTIIFLDKELSQSLENGEKSIVIFKTDSSGIIPTTENGAKKMRKIAAANFFT